MHELTVIENILNISAKVADDNDLKSVTAINVDVGSMQHLNEEIMKNGFEAAKEDTIFASAELKLNWLEVKLRCNSCLKIFTPGGENFFCPYCGDNDTNLIQGMELIVKSIEGE